MTLKYFLSRLVALDVGVDLTFGKFSDVRVGGITAQNVLDLDATSGRFTIKGRGLASAGSPFL